MKCQNCGEREGTSRWLGTGCQLCAIRSGGIDILPMWCDLCTVKEQIKFCSSMAAMLPTLEQRLKELTS